MIRRSNPPELHAPLDELKVTSPFGLRDCPFNESKKEGHPGVDFRCAVGTPVFAVADGQVSRSYLSAPKPPLRSYGERIVINHAGGYESSYAHLHTRIAQVGQEVRAGQLIGLSGNTGASTGPHLHFELRRDGAPIDPMPLFPKPTERKSK